MVQKTRHFFEILLTKVTIQRITVLKNFNQKMEPKATTSDKSNLLTTTQINSYFSRSGPKLAAKTACHENLEYMKEINKTIYTIYLQSITDIHYQIEIKNSKKTQH